MSVGGRGQGKGRSGALLRGRSDPPEAPQPSRPLASSILTADELAQLEAGRLLKEARQARARELEEARARAERDHTLRWQAERDDAERVHLEALGRWGPCLPPYRRRSPRLYAQEEDIEDLIPDGWGKDEVFRQDAKRLAARVGFSWATVMVLVFVEWFHGLRGPLRRSSHGTGGGLQASPEFLGRKLGLAERTIQRVQRTLDPKAEWRRECAAVAFKNETREPGAPELPQPPKPQGTVYCGRFPQLKLYAALTADLPPEERFRRWMDKSRQLHEWVDLTGVYLPTYMGVRVLRRRKYREELQPLPKGAARSGRPLRARGVACGIHGCGRELYRRTGHCRKHFEARRRLRPLVPLRPVAMQRDLYQRLRPIYRRLRARLAPRPAGTITPSNDHRVETDLYAGPGGAVDKFSTPDQTRPSRSREARYARPRGLALDGTAKPRLAAGQLAASAR